MAYIERAYFMLFPRIISYNNYQLLFSTVSRHDYSYSMSLLIEL